MAVARGIGTPHSVRARVGTACVLALLATGACGDRLSKSDLAALAASTPAAPAARAASDAANETAGPAPEAVPTGVSVGVGDAAATTPAAAATAPSPGASPSRAGGASAAAVPTGPTPGSAAAPSVPARRADRPTDSAAAPTTPPAGSASPPSPGTPIALGSFGAETGPIGALNVPVIGAVKAWAADLNARGGLHGHPVRVIYGDDGGDPNRALAIVRKMVEQDGILAIVGEHAPTTLDAVAPYLESKGVPFMGGIEGATRALEHSSMSFMPTIVATDAIAWAHMLPLTQIQGTKKIGVIYCREVAGCAEYTDRIKGFAPKLGWQVVSTSQASLAQPDFTAEVLAARNAGADSLISIMDNASAVRIARARNRQNWNAPISEYGDANSESFFKQGGSEIDGVVASCTTADWATAPSMQPYRDAMARYQPGVEKGCIGGNAWAGGKLLEAASTQLPAQPTSKDIVAGLLALRNESLGGIVPPLTFPKSGSRTNVNQCVVLGVVKGGKFVPKGNDPDQFTCVPGWQPAA